MNTVWERLKAPVYDKWRRYWIEKHPTDIGEKSWNAIFDGGKQLRPSLCCEMYSILQPDATHSTQIAELAFAIECIHIASLILDDTPYMDNSDFRRNKPAIHKQFSVKQSLVFSYEIFEIIQIIWRQNLPANRISEEDWWRILKSKLVQLAFGQIYDLQNTEDIYTLATLKTGTLFEMACELPAILSGASADYWRTWGRMAGVLFQWADDWSDMYSDKIQGARNAFLEEYDTVIQYYQELYRTISADVLIQKNSYICAFLNYLQNTVPPPSHAPTTPLLQIPILYDTHPVKNALHLLMSSQVAQKSLFERMKIRFTKHVHQPMPQVLDDISIYVMVQKVLLKIMSNSENNVYIYNTEVLWKYAEDAWDDIIISEVRQFIAS